VSAGAVPVALRSQSTSTRPAGLNRQLLVIY
jgi:hypothetical protein